MKKLFKKFPNEHCPIAFQVSGLAFVLVGIFLL